MDGITGDSTVPGGWKVQDTNSSGGTPNPADAATFGAAIAKWQQEMADKGTMTREESQAPTTKWYAVEKGDNLWTMTEHHLESTWGRPVTDKEIAGYWENVCKDNPFRNDNIIHEGQVVAFQDPGPDPRNPAGSGADIDKAAKGDATEQAGLKKDLDTYFGSLDPADRAGAAVALLKTTETPEGQQAVAEGYLRSLLPGQRAAAAETLKEKFPLTEPGKGQGHDGHPNTQEKRNNDTRTAIEKAQTATGTTA
jgi:hypothetical protein